MIRKPSPLQYALLALVACLGLVFTGLGVQRSYLNLAHGTEIVIQPFYNGTSGRSIALSPDQAHVAGLPAHFHPVAITAVDAHTKPSGLKAGDAVLNIAGRPFTGYDVLLSAMATHTPGQTLDVLVLPANAPPNAAPIHLTVPLGPERPRNPPILAWTIQGGFTLLPLVFFLTGLYVVFARPRSPDAWLILGILAYVGALFLRAPAGNSATLALSLVWSTLAQTAMPLCFMLFGIYFPQRASIDRRIPWFKWIVLTVILGLLPTDLLYDYGLGFNFNALAPLIPCLTPINTIENVVSCIGISFAFFCLYGKLGDPAIAPDARRRVRILIAGSSVGLAPFLGLLAISLFRGEDLGSSVPQWLALTVFALLCVFPLTLAYVVVVQRAMDLRILIRQGTKYFFARQSIAIIGFILGTWMSYLITLFLSARGHQRTVDIVQIVGTVSLFTAYATVGAKRLRLWVDQKFFREAYSTEQLLAELSDEARNFTETAPLLETISTRLAATLHIDRIAVFLRSGDMFQLQFATGLPLAPGFFPALPAASTTIATLTRGKASPANVYRDDPTSWLVDATDAERTALADLSTELLVPLPGRNRLVGVIALGPKSSEEPYSKTDRQLLQTIASQTGLALENAELLANLTVELAQRASINREIEIAREVQERLFPQTYPQIEGVGLAGFCRPAQFVGGDYYDFFLIPQAAVLPASATAGLLAIAIGDISGKGISAALLMASLRASLRSVATLQANDGSRNLATLMQHVNRLVYEASTSNRYATFFYAELDPVTRILTYVNAGHNCPVILRGTGPTAQVIQLQPTGTVIGLLPDATYDQATIQLQPGDTLLAFTDGISEAMTADDEEWGEDRMIAAAQTLLAEPNCTHTAVQLLDCLLAQADAFTAGAPQHDDMTLLLCTLA